MSMEALQRKLAGGPDVGGDPGMPPGAPPEATGASDDVLLDDFVNNPNPLPEDVTNVVKALARTALSGGAAPPPPPPMAPPPMGGPEGPPPPMGPPPVM